MCYGNFEAGNTSALNVLAQSAISVNYNIYKWTVAEPILLLSSDGSTSNIETSGGGGDYYIVAVVNANSECSVYARLSSDVTISWSADYGGWYITGTQVRVLGGFTKGNGFTRKWRYQTSGPSAERRDYSLRVFADGIEHDAIINHSPLSLYSASGTVSHQTTPVDLVTFDAACPSRLVVPITAASYGDGSGNGYVTSYDIVLIALTQEGAELGVIATETFSAGASSLTQNAVFAVNPGRHKIRFVPKHFVCNYMVNGHQSTASLYVQTSAMSAYLTDIYGAPKGSY